MLILQVKELTAEKSVLEGKLARLQDDFTYNLELLDGRDAELSGYEEQFGELQEYLGQVSSENEMLNAQLCTLAKGKSRDCLLPEVIYVRILQGWHFTRSQK